MFRQCTSRLLLGLALCLLGSASVACLKGPAKPKVAHHAEAWQLFGTHRDALPRFAVTMPLPMDEKYWTYSAALHYPDAALSLTELAADLAQAPLAEQAHRATLLRQHGGVPDSDLEQQMWDSTTALLAGTAGAEALPPIDALATWVAAYVPERSWDSIGMWLIETQIYNTLDSTTPLERTDLSFEQYVRAQRDFHRLQLADTIAIKTRQKSMMPFLRPLTSAENSLAVRLEAARTMFALGETDQRALLLYLGFGDTATMPMYGWPTYAFLAERQDPDLYESLRNKATLGPPGERGQYLVHLAQYGHSQDVPILIAWVKELLPRMPEERIGPEIPPVAADQARARGSIEIAPAVGSPPRELQVQLVQQASQDEEEANDPHADLLSKEELAAVFGYETQDVNAAMRLRVLRHFVPVDVLPTIHEALLKGGPATRIAAAELLSELGTAQSQEMLVLTWKDEADPLVLAELAHAWLMIEQHASES